MKLASYTQGAWRVAEANGEPLFDATTGEVVGEVAASGVDYAGVLHYARSVGGPSLRRLTFHERAALLKNLAKALGERKQELYELSLATGATQADSVLDIEGGLGTLFCCHPD